MNPGQSASGVEERIKGWLRESGWEFEDLPLDPKLAWGVRASEGGVSPLAIYGMSGRPDMTIIQTDAPMNPAQVSQFNKMKGEARDELILDIRSLLFSHHTDYHLEEDSHKVVILDRIFLDGFTKDSFWRRLIAVRAKALEVIIFFHRKLGGLYHAGPVN